MRLGLYVSIGFIFAFTCLYPSTKVLTTCYLAIFIFATSFIIYACHNGHGGLVNDFLSSKYWMPLAKMSLSIYLVMPGIQTYNIVMKKRPLEFEKDFNVVIFGKPTPNTHHENSFSFFRSQTQPTTCSHHSRPSCCCTSSSKRHSHTLANCSPESSRE
jgi:hypothetical protein